VTFIASLVVSFRARRGASHAFTLHLPSTEQKAPFSGTACRADFAGVGMPHRECKKPLFDGHFRKKSERAERSLSCRRFKQEAGHMIELLKRFAADQSGATAIEYGLIAAGISVAIITVVQGLGTKLNSTFGTVKNALK
jgi:pilus assembly protein Flp/PilA